MPGTHAVQQELQANNEELETSNEELKAANEELQANNEELQSTNEELESSKEELQSTNEELETTNLELHRRNRELVKVDDDITNLFKSTDLGTLFLDAGLKIKRFTSTAAQIFNLVETDKGRPISDITHKLRYDRFGQDLQEVLDDLSKKEMDVQTRTGEWLTIRIRPYRTSQDVIDGVIVTFTEVTSLKNAEIEARQAHRTMEGIMDTIRQPLVVLDGDLILRFANDAFFKRFSLLPEKALLHRFTDLLERRWDVEALKENIKKMASADGVSEIKFPGVPAGERGEILLGRCVERDGDEPKLILLTFEEKCAEE